MNGKWILFLGVLSATLALALGFWLRSVLRPSPAARSDSYLEQPVQWFEARFVGEKSAPGLIGTPRPIPRQGHRRSDLLAFTHWFDDKPRFVYGWTARDTVFGLPSRWRVVSGGLESYAEQDAGGATIFDLALLATPHSNQLIAAVNDKHSVFRTKVVSLDETGKRSWEYRALGLSLKDFAILHGADGPYGVLVGVGGETGLVALDRQGDILWSRPRRYVVYEVHTHPDLPGLFLEVGGEFAVFRHSPEGAAVTMADGDKDYYMTEGLLFPDAEGQPSVIGAGSLLGRDDPLLFRMNAREEEVWRICPRSRIEALALVEPAGRERLIAATTRGGHLLLIDEHGTLRSRVELPRERPQLNMATYALCAGELAPGHWAIGVKLLEDSFLYELDLGALDAK